jgi:hypothetical protein
MPEEEIQNELKLEASIDGQKYSLDLNDFTGLEARDFRRAVGVSMLRAAELVGSGDLDTLEMFGAVKWLVDRRDNPELTYEAVLEKLSYRSLTEEAAAEDPPTQGALSGAPSPPSPTILESGRGR